MLPIIWMIWPTKRPAAMRECYQHWMRTARHPEAITTKVAVDTEEEYQALADIKGVMIVPDAGGCIKAINALTRAIDPAENDIVALAQDDIFPQDGWDDWVREQLSDFHGCLMIDDGYQYGGCIPSPVMHAKCFRRLNGIINHPAYNHLYADAELYQNVEQLGLLKNVRKLPMQFEHRHWANGKRVFDEVDCRPSHFLTIDEQIYHQRMQMSIEDRLKC